MQPRWLRLNEVALRAALLRLCIQGSHWPRKTAQCCRFLQLCVGLACCQKTLVTQSFAERALLLRMWKGKKVPQLFFCRALVAQCFQVAKDWDCACAESADTSCSSSHSDSSQKRRSVAFLPLPSHTQGLQSIQSLCACTWLWVEACARTCFSPPVLKYARAIHIQDGGSTV